METGKARILFVDDEQRVLNSMRGMFRRDFELFLATEGSEAIRIAAETPIDVIVADQRMPGMTGIEVLGKIKQISPNTVRILLTGYADPGAVEGSINIGEVFRFLSKPCPPKVLRDTLNLAVAATRRPTATPAAPKTETAAPKADVPYLRPTTERHRVTSAKLLSTRSELPVVVSASLERRDNDAATTSSFADTADQAGPAASNDPLLSRLTSIGEVAHAWDRFKKRDEVESKPPAAISTKELGVVVYTVDAGFAEAALRAVSTRRPTTLATSLIKVMRALELAKPGVLVTDVSANGATLQKILSALKQLKPDLVTVVVSNSRDTSDMVGLINHGQIFRFLKKPVEPGNLVSAIDAAAVKCLELRLNPDSVRRHSVVPTSSTLSAADTLKHALGGSGRGNSLN